MSSTITATGISKITVTETFVGSYVSTADATAGFGDQLGETLTLTASSSVPVTKHAEFQKTMSGGAATIDLTALPGKTADETIDGTGLKVQLAKFRNLSTNANDITITFGASNPYNLCGSAFVITLKPGQSIMFSGNEAAPDVGGGAKEIDISGTLAQVLEVQFVLG